MATRASLIRYSWRYVADAGDRICTAVIDILPTFFPEKLHEARPHGFAAKIDQRESRLWSRASTPLTL